LLLEYVGEYKRDGLLFFLLSGRSGRRDERDPGRFEVTKV
jgi:hypothetical protein